MAKFLDLLGDPIPEGFGRRGRPEHVATDENRFTVRMLLAFDKDDNYIARGIRVSVPTLRKHYFRELKFRDEARPALEAALMRTTIAEALAGNASMMKEARKLLERHDLEKLGIKLDGRIPKAAKLGKKDAKRAAALEPDTTTPMGELLARRQAGVAKPN